ncbi:uncharacterized protein METZ01_LOCUS197481 [marine metagenome]|uniref:Uncharacterized protein n=1 Tax=marine metagenome TaxID=408172 RepID=A0A382E431_9ZZZZ
MQHAQPNMSENHAKAGPRGLSSPIHGWSNPGATTLPSA